jgi:PAS domain S-box-containing protein
MNPYPHHETEPITPLAREALDTSSEGVAIYTAEPFAIACTIVYANEALAQLTGFPCESLVGHSALLLAGARPDAAAIASVLPPLGHDELEVRARKQKPDGSVYEVDVTVTPIRADGTRVTHYLARQTKVEARRSLPPEEIEIAHADESGVFAKTGSHEGQEPLRFGSPGR